MLSSSLIATQYHQVHSGVLFFYVFNSFLIIVNLNLIHNIFTYFFNSRIYIEYFYEYQYHCEKLRINHSKYCVQKLLRLVPFPLKVGSVSHS